MSEAHTSLPGLSRLQNGTGLYSQASNFFSHISTGVDPRTGQFTLALALPIGAANNLTGPSISATLAFSPMGSAINHGFGRGWSLTLSELNLATGSLRLSTGEQFSVDTAESDFTDGGELAFFDRKLQSFRVITQGGEGSEFRIEYKSGDVEVLRIHESTNIAVPVQVRAPEGRCLFLQWLPSGNTDSPALSEISDESRVLLRITPQTGLVVVETLPDSPVASSLSLIFAGDRLTLVVLPDPAQSQWQFDYEEIDGLLFPSEIKGPLGSVDSVLYASGQQGHQLPPGAPLASIPRVVSWAHSAGASSQALYKSYEWIGEQNFLGYGADLPAGWEDGKDNLYQVNQPYTYGVYESLSDEFGTDLGTITRWWNRFHLQTEETTVCQGKIVRVLTEYGDVPDLYWEAQPAWCQLPAKVTTEYEDSTRPTLGARREVTETRYDNYGNILYFRDASGVVETREYYPLSGADGCPPDPLDFARWTRSYTVTPASLEDGTSGGAPTLATTYRYAVIPSLLADAPHHVAVCEERIAQFTPTGLAELGTTTQTFVTDYGADHGRPLTSVSTLNNLSTATAYVYQLTEDRLTIQTTVTGYEGDAINRVIERNARSIFTGLTLMEEDQDGVVETFTHDLLGRVTSKVTAAGSANEVTLTCNYQLIGEQRALAVQVEETDATGARSRLYLDGDGRALRTEIEDVDNAPGTFREVVSTCYDALGRIVQETVTDWMPGDASPLSLTTTYAYDGWGNRTTTSRADGTVENVLYDPVRLRAEQWLSGADGSRTASTLTWLNVAGSVTRTEQRDLSGLLVSCRDLLRDGLDRIIQQSDIVPAQKPIITRTRYDFHGRVISRTLPDDTVLSWSYAAHSDDDHPISVEVAAKDTAPVTVGTQTFDGLGRQRSIESGGRTRSLHYVAGLMPPASQITARGHLIEYAYESTLNNLLTSVTQGSDRSTFTYHPLHAQMRIASSPMGDQETLYAPSGKPLTQRWKAGKEVHTNQWRHSLLGRLLHVTDVSGTATTFEYDAQGRLIIQMTDTVMTAFEYDAFSRQRRVTTRDRDQGRSLTQTLTYDEFGREQGREIDVTSSLPDTQHRRQTLSYTPLNQVQRRVWLEGDRELSNETYEYDSRGRLTKYTADGPDAPTDTFGNILRIQSFTLNALDGYAQVISEYADGSKDVATFTYASEDPTQIKEVTHTHPSWPKRLAPTYDAHGNVTIDGQGRELTWDTQNRLIRVTEGPRTCEYRYNPLGQLAETVLDDETIQRFYRGNEVANERDYRGWIDYLGSGGMIFARSRISQAVRAASCSAENDLAQTEILLLGSDAQGTVRLELADALRAACYTPHGVRGGEKLESQPGFAGEWADRLTGWYMPGSYRPYDPVLMCFLSPDSDSPFGGGGLNPYAYCGGDPVNNIDPDGHAWWKWLVAGVGMALAVVGTVASFGTAVPAIAALWAGGMGALTVGGGLAIASAGLAAVSLATGVASMTLEATGGDQKAAGILGWISLGTGLASAVTGLAPAAAKAAARASRAAGRLSKSIKGPKQAKGKLIFERKLGEHDVYAHDNLYGEGIFAYETHGDPLGRLMNSSGKMQSATKVAKNDILPQLNALAPNYPADKPIILAACWGGRSGAAQKVANVLQRPVIGFKHTILVDAPSRMRRLSVTSTGSLKSTNVITHVRTNPFVLLRMRLQGIPNEAIAGSRYYFPV
jgi:RHS repeat-associated protein